jgi:hypothetical protein
VERAGLISPDGTMLVCAGDGRLWIRDLAALEAGN